MIQIHQAYRKLWTTNKRYIILSGGRGSGKSFALSVFLNQLLLEQGHNILFTRYTMVSAEISIIPEFKDKTEMLGFDEISFTGKTVECTNGNRLYFSGIKTSEGVQTAKLKSIPDLTTWVVDEAEELPDKDIFTDIDLSIRSKVAQNRVILVLNPSHKKHWIYKEFFLKHRDDTEYIHTDYRINRHNLHESFINAAERAMRENYKNYENKYLGIWRDSAVGRIYEYEIVDDIPECDEVIFGLDFGYSISHTAVVEVGFKGDYIYITEKYYAREVLYRDIAASLLEIVQNKSREIWADCARPEGIEEIYMLTRLNIKEYTKGAGSVLEGINAVKRHKIKVHRSSVNLINEMDNYRWKTTRDGSPVEEPVKELDDLMDAMRYAVHSKYRGAFTPSNENAYIASSFSNKSKTLHDKSRSRRVIH